MITVLRWILFPISLIYHFIIWIRNLLYDKKILQSKSFNIPTIVIGNLAIGGTGKSPMTEYLIRLLKDKYKIATLSRGYGRKTKGFRLVQTDSKAIEVGDEPLQFKSKFPDITVAVNENRCEGIEKLQTDHHIILLDDAYQHRKLTPGFSILLFDFHSLMKPILSLPTGNFRDILPSTKRANLIVITKCPNHISDKAKSRIEKVIRKYNTAPIFYTKIAYDTAKSMDNQFSLGELTNKEILLFCGIANPAPLVEHLSDKGNIVHLIQFPDHHNYTNADFEKIKDKFNSLAADEKIIISTEKDIQRVDTELFQNYPLFYIPIHLQTVDNQQHTFDHFIEKYISEYYS